MKSFDDLRERDYNVPKMTLRKHGAFSTNPKKHREQVKKYLNQADFEEDDIDDFE